MRARNMDQQMEMLRARLAQVADLQCERREIIERGSSPKSPVDTALRLAQIDAALRFARSTLSTVLRSLPEADRTRFIKEQVQTSQ